MSSVPVPPPRHKKKSHGHEEERHAAEMPSPMMAGAAHNVARHLAPSYQEVSSTPNLQEGQGRGSSKDALPRSITPTALDEGIPETTIGEYVTVKGELEFDRLLRINGNFEGKLISEGDLVVGPQGKLTGHVDNIRSMLVEGHVVGNISVERLALRGAAFVYGDITCRSISVEPSVMVSGRVNIHPLAPKAIQPDGSVSSSSSDSQKLQEQAPTIQREKGEFHFPGSEKASEQLIVSSDKRTLLPAEEKQGSANSLNSEAAKKQEEEEMALKQLNEQRSQLETQIAEQKEHAARAREEEEKELNRLRAEADRLKLEEERHTAEAKKLKEEAAAEVARLQVEAAKREESSNVPPVGAAPAADDATPVDATPPADVVA